MSANCIRTCEDLHAWRADLETGDAISDSNFGDDIGVLMHMVAARAGLATQTQSKVVRQEQCNLQRGYVNSLLEGCQQRGLNGLGVLVAILDVASEAEECGECPFRIVQLDVGQEQA